MIKCNKCQKLVTKVERIPVEYRDVEYYSAVIKKKGMAGRKRSRKRFKFLYSKQEVIEHLEMKNSKGKNEWELSTEKRTKGKEIVREINICQKCLKEQK